MMMCMCTYTHCVVCMMKAHTQCILSPLLSYFLSPYNQKHEPPWTNSSACRKYNCHCHVLSSIKQARLLPCHPTYIQSEYIQIYRSLYRFHHRRRCRVLKKCTCCEKTLLHHNVSKSTHDSLILSPCPCT